RPRLARSPLKYPDIPQFDAHEHVMEGGEENLFEIFRRARVRQAVIAALPSDVTYRGFHDANLRVLALASAHPGTILPFVILPPAVPHLVRAFEDYFAKGARGLKLMTGHGSYFEAGGAIELDDPEMMEVFRFCESRSIPVLWHVNMHLYGRGF